LSRFTSNYKLLEKMFLLYSSHTYCRILTLWIQNLLILKLYFKVRGRIKFSLIQKMLVETQAITAIKKEYKNKAQRSKKTSNPRFLSPSTRYIRTRRLITSWSVLSTHVLCKLSTSFLAQTRSFSFAKLNSLSTL